ncbi:hypothetical protein CBLAS_0307 [Campylobacter blaseri]|uniref:Type II secretion system protein n=1 Tax=Campylobacter blaseri TaxID=2042961 RepID=A0A2P8R1C6_9BACT|nr:type II secretion system protein [Campylobacter blaseri]PSM52307.1 type II secretion system protein [Campylobacter blaseri]PSM54073.1 type II secretion system protein [Campylobacter blaseri]QKF85515.1 hypothetical protein CBLAS_0307 [Campylobacter blaseri]
MNEEGILVSLGYVMNDSTLKQVRAILSKCDFDSNELDRIVTLNDRLKTYGAYIAMSNSNDYFKIKNEPKQESEKEVVRDMIFTWADKYKFELEKVADRETYYIVGRI